MGHQVAHQRVHDVCVGFHDYSNDSYSIDLLASPRRHCPYGATPNEQPETDTTPGYRVALLVVLLVILGASAVTHQITPAALCLVFFGFALTGRTSLRMLWVFTAVLVWAWLSWEAHTYWAGHLAKILGSAGQIGSTLNSTVGRVSGESPSAGPW